MSTVFEEKWNNESPLSNIIKYKKSITDPPRAMANADLKSYLIKVFTTHTLMGPTGIQMRKPVIMPIRRAMIMP